MDFETLKDILLFVGGCICSVVAWFVGRRKQKNDFLAELQKSIDLLTSKYTEKIEENIKLQTENANLRVSDAEHIAFIETLEKKIDLLSKKVDSLTRQLKNYEKSNQGISPIIPTVARNNLVGSVRSDKANGSTENGGNGRGGTNQLKSRSSERSRTRRSAVLAATGTDGAKNNDEGGDGTSPGRDEFNGDTDTEPS